MRRRRTTGRMVRNGSKEVHRVGVRMEGEE